MVERGDSMQRVVVTGSGVVSSIGVGKDAVCASLRAGYSGMRFLPEMAALGYRCCVYAPVVDVGTGVVPRRWLRTVSAAGTYAVVAALEALDDAALDCERLDKSVDLERFGVVVGTGAGGANEVFRAEDYRRSSKRLAGLGGVGVVKIMNSTASANLAADLGARGRSASLSAACATGLYNLGHAFELIRWGVLDLALAGSAEEDLWKFVGLSGDNSGGMPTSYNESPAEACRPFDRDRGGFVMSAGAGILVLEELGHARARGARIHAEIVGYGAANDGEDMFAPSRSGVGLRRAIGEAMATARDCGVNSIDYVNAHGTGTLLGDRVEAQVLASVLGDEVPVSSTKAISGHAQGATASQEAVYTLIMLNEGFIAPTRNLDNVAPECAGINHVRQLHEGQLHTAMTCNSGLGGANACLILRAL